MTRVLPLGLAAVLLAGTPAVSAITETFDTLPGMSNSPGSPVPVASRLSQQYLPDGVVFSSGAGYAAVVNHEPGVPNAEPSPPNIIGGTTAAGALNYSIPITATFWFDGDLAQAGVTDYVQVLGDLIAVPGTATLQAFGIDGMLIGSDTEMDQETGGLNLSLHVAGIHSIELTETSATIGFDNFTFDPVTLPPSRSAVPEPASWAMMFGGFLSIGAGFRRRRLLAGSGAGAKT